MKNYGNMDYQNGEEELIPLNDARDIRSCLSSESPSLTGGVYKTSDEMRSDAQTDKWLKENGLFNRFYAEGDIVV